MSKDVWALLEKLDKDPNLNPELTLGINTNLNVSRHLIDKMIKLVNSIAPRIKQVQLFTSNEATGAQAEYTRYGLNYNEWMENVDHVYCNMPDNAFVAMMTTINILSLSTIDLFFEDILNLRKKYYKSYSNNNMILSINYLRYPQFLNMQLAPDNLKKEVSNKLKALIEKYNDGVYHLEGHYATLYQDEREKITMICNLLEHSVSNKEVDLIDFYKFIEEYDRRKGTDFNSTFPELIEFKNYCKGKIDNE